MPLTWGRRRLLVPHESACRLLLRTSFPLVRGLVQPKLCGLAALDTHVCIGAGRFDRSLLEPFSNAHGGKGEIFFRMIWGPRDFKSNLSHLHHLLLPPVSAILPAADSLSQYVVIDANS